MQFVLALKVIPSSNPLRLNLVLLLEDALEPVKAVTRADAAVVVPMHERPDLLLDMMEYRRMTISLNITTTNEMLCQGLLLVQVASPV